MASTTLYKGQTLNPGHYLESQNHLYRALMRTDGKFVVYHYLRENSERHTAWGLGNSMGEGGVLHIPADGMRIEGQRPPGTRRSMRGCLPPGGPQSNIYACKFGYDPFLVMQDDGNLVLYSHTPSGIKSIWSSDTWVSNEKQVQDHRPPGYIAIEIPDAVTAEEGPYVFSNESPEPIVFISKNKVTGLDPGESMVLTSPGSLALPTASLLLNGGPQHAVKRYVFLDDNTVAAGPGDASPKIVAVDDAIEEDEPKFFKFRKVGATFQLEGTSN